MLGSDFDTNDRFAIFGFVVPKDPSPQWKKVAWSHDCALLAYADSTGTVRVFDLMGSELFVIPPVSTSNLILFFPLLLSQLCISAAWWFRFPIWLLRHDVPSVGFPEQNCFGFPLGLHCLCISCINCPPLKWFCMLWMWSQFRRRCKATYTWTIRYCFPMERAVLICLRWPHLGFDAFCCPSPSSLKFNSVRMSANLSEAQLIRFAFIYDSLVTREEQRIIRVSQLAELTMHTDIEAERAARVSYTHFLALHDVAYLLQKMSKARTWICLRFT